MRGEEIRSEIHRLIQARPFRPFVLALENDNRIAIGHPENIAFDPGNGAESGSPDFYIITGRLRLYSTFDAVTSVSSAEPADQFNITS